MAGRYTPLLALYINILNSTLGARLMYLSGHSKRSVQLQHRLLRGSTFLEKSVTKSSLQKKHQAVATLQYVSQYQRVPSVSNIKAVLPKLLSISALAW